MPQDQQNQDLQVMNKHLAKKLNMVITNDSWVFFEQYLEQELERAYIKFDSLVELQEFYAIQAEIKILKKLLNIKEFIRQSLEN